MGTMEGLHACDDHLRRTRLRTRFQALERGNRSTILLVRIKTLNGTDGMKLDGKEDSGLQDRDAFDMLDNAWTPRGVSICGVCATGGGSPPPPLPSTPRYAFTRLPL